MSVHEPWFAVRRTYTAKPMFGRDKEQREFVDHDVVQAASIEDARDFAISRSSVYAIDQGLMVDVLPLDWREAVAFCAKYDGPPMTDAHAATGAKLVVSAAANSQAGPSA